MLFILLNTTYINTITISGNEINISYNNSITNNESVMFLHLARVNNKLYYNADVSAFKYGTYEISNVIAKRIYWEGFSFDPIYLNLQIIGDGKLLLEENSGELCFYNFEKNKATAILPRLDRTANS